MVAGLAIAGLVAQLLATAVYAPAMAFAKPTAGSAAAERVRVCTPDGFKTVTLGEPRRQPGEDGPAEPHTMFCLICMGLAGCVAIATPAEQPVAAPIQPSAAATPWPDRQLPLNGIRPSPLSRGPPL